MADPQSGVPSANETAMRLRRIIDIQSMLVSMKFNLSDFMQAVVEQVQAATSATGATVELVEGNELLFRAASGTATPYIGQRLPLGTSLSGLCVNTGEVLVSANTEADPRVDLALCRTVGAASMVVVPLRRLDTIIGVLKIVSLQTNAFGTHEIDMLRMMAGLLGAALGQQLEIDHRVHLEAKLSHMAQHDALTGLPNRALFEDRLEQAFARCLRNGNVLALMYIDVDHFKTINDSHGHAIGDTLLRAFAERITKLVRSIDTVARLGGDEFALIVGELQDQRDAEDLAVKILESMRQVFVLEGLRLKVTASIGVAAVSATTATDTDSLIRRADTAMYAAKKAGRDTFRSVSGQDSCAVAMPANLRRTTA